MGIGFFEKIVNLINGPSSQKEESASVATTAMEETDVDVQNVVNDVDEVQEEQDFVPCNCSQIETVEESAQSQPQSAHKSKPNNGIERSDLLRKKICDELQSCYCGTGVTLNDKNLLIYVEDSLFCDALEISQFSSDLRLMLVNELGFEFNEVLLKNEVPTQQTLTQVMPKVYLQVQNIKEFVAPVTVCRAVIEMIPGCGSLVEDSVILDAQEIFNLPANRYNIGAGKSLQMPNGLARTNHIAINDNPAASDFDKNKYVSRTHAYITYHQDYGFLLNVESGTRANGKRTHICRNGLMMECDNPIVPVPLQDKDCIVLSKNVHLMFSLIPE